MEVIASNKGGMKLCFGGYMYTKQVSKPNHVRWRCVKRTLRCKGSLTTTLEVTNPVPVNEHNHLPDATDISVAKARNSMREMATSTMDKPNQVYSRAVAGLDNDTLAFLPRTDSIKRTLRNHRRANFPSDPMSLEDLIIDGPWAETAGENPENFLLYDNGPMSDSRVVVFAADQCLEKLASAETWFMDGNFAMAPALFQQLYVVRVPLGETAISVAYALLTNKTQQTYEELLQALVDGCRDRHWDADPKTIILDFEIAVIQAIRSVIGNQVRIQCCFYHLTQSTWRKIQELGLSNLYRENEEFRVHCGMLDALALLPTEDVCQGMAYVRDNFPDEGEALIQYFDATYVTGSFRRVQQPNRPLMLRRIPPRFPPSLWNVHDATVNGNPRTNNQCEGWNNKFQHLVGQNHPSVWRLINCLKDEHSCVSALVLQDEIGNPPRKRTKRVYRDLQERLQNLCIAYAEGQKSLQDFLRGAARNIRLGDL